MVGIRQTTADSVESDSPGGISGKSYKSISAPKRPQSLARNNGVQERRRRWMLPEPGVLPQRGLTGRYVRESFKRRHLIAFGVCHLKAWRWCQAGPVVNQRHICMAANLNAKWATSKHTHTHTPGLLSDPPGSLISAWTHPALGEAGYWLGSIQTEAVRVFKTTRGKRKRSFKR